MPGKKKVTRAISRLRIFENEEFDFQLLRILGSAIYGGASVGECLSTARKIKDGDLCSWVGEWRTTAGSLKNEAEFIMKNGDPVGAREAFLRASMYYRAAEYYGFYTDPAKKQDWEDSRTCFKRAGELFPKPFEAVEIPFENLLMPGYFLQPDHSEEKKATVILVTGFDGTAEELYFQCGAGLLARGYNVLSFEGPGQAGMTHLYPHICFRPDFEAPMKAVLDYLLIRPEVDPRKIAVIGMGLGGYFATRAAVYEKRIQACAASSPIVELRDYLLGILSEELKNTSPADYVDTMKKSPCFRWSVENFTRRCGTPDLPSLLEQLGQFSYAGHEGNITCPTLTLVGEGEGPESLAQAWHFYNSVRGPRMQHIFTLREGADANCQMNNLSILNSIICRWLDSCLKNEGTPSEYETIT